MVRCNGSAIPSARFKSTIALSIYSMADSPGFCASLPSNWIISTGLAWQNLSLNDCSSLPYDDFVSGGKVLNHDAAFIFMFIASSFILMSSPRFRTFAFKLNCSIQVDASSSLVPKNGPGAWIPGSAIVTRIGVVGVGTTWFPAEMAALNVDCSIGVVGTTWFPADMAALDDGVCSPSTTGFATTFVANG